MSNIKELKSIELTSFTTVVTAVSLLFSIIAAVIVTVAIGIIHPSNIGVSIYIIPTIIVGTFMFTIYNAFSEGLFYNLLSKKLKNIKLTIDGNKISKISTTETATLCAIIIAIEAILLYLVSVFVLPLIINATIQTLMFGGQQTIAYSLYQILLLINQPVTILLFIFASFIVTFVFVLLGTYIYNILANAGRGIIINLSKEDKLTAVDSVDSLKLAIAAGIISGVLSIILAIISIISGGNVVSAIGTILGGFVGVFIEFYLVGVFYNFLAPKIGKLKLELIDE